MPINHVLTATTPDDPAWEIRPSHWNSAHSISLVGSEISGAFSNGGNVSFGLSANGYLTASANVTAAPSPVNITGANGSSVNAQTIQFGNANGMSLGVSTAANGATVTGSYTVPTQSQQPMAASAANGSFTANTLSFSNANGVSFGTSAGSAITASVNTSYRASNDAIGLNSAVSNVTATINSAGLSLDARGYAGTGTSNTGAASFTLNSNGLQFNGTSLAGVGTTFNGTNISGSMTLNTAGLRLDLSGPAAGGAGFSAGVSGGNTSGDTGATGTRVVFAGGNNITLSQSTNANGATVTISGANAGGAQTGISGVVVSNTTYTSGTITLQNANGISFGSSGANGISASYTVPSTAGLISAVGVTGQNGNFTTTGLSFSNANGISFGTSAGSAITASHNGLTTARASNDGIGLNTAQTNVTWTVNSSGLSLNAAGYAGTGTSNTGAAAFTLNSNGLQFNGASLAGTSSGFTGANISASITHNTAGLALSMSVAAGGGVNPVASASNGSFSFTTLAFSNANNVTFGTSAGSIITASVAAPGAAAENNAINLLGANTAGNTTATGSTIGWSGVNLTLSGTNASQVVISAPATSSLSATGLLSISTNGSTISMGVPVIQASTWMPVHPNGSTTLAPIGNGSVQLVPAFNADPFSVSRAVVYISNSISSSSNSSHAGALSVFVGFYTRTGSTLSMASSGSQSYQWSNTSNNSLASLSGHRGLTVPVDVNYTGGDLWMAFMSRSSTTNANWFTARNIIVSGFSSQIVGNIGEGTNNSRQLLPGWGHYSATSAGLPSSVAFSQINGQGSNNGSIPLIPIIAFANYTA